MESNSVKTLMTSTVVAVTPETPLIKAVNVLLDNNFNGLPVIDKDGVLVGIVTEYDLISRGSSIHLPTLMKLLDNIDLYLKDLSLIKEDVKVILNMKVSDVMNRDPLTLSEEATIQDAAKSFNDHHKVNPIPIIDSARKIIGIVSRYDIIKLFGAELNTSQEQKGKEAEENISKFIDSFKKKFQS